MLPRGQIFYDDSCGMCSASYRRFGRMTERRGFKWIPLQEPRARTLLNLEGDELPRELQLFTRKGRLLGGVDAILYVMKTIWWAWPIWLIAKVPGVRPLLRLLYRWIASHRHAISGACRLKAAQPLPKRPAQRNVA
jgi:predicted DCC family thiol-disulfide oxidoreductase YuxK